MSELCPYLLALHRPGALEAPIARLLDALIVVIEATSAYVELAGEEAETTGFALARPHGAPISRGVIATASGESRAIVSPSALADPTLRELRSVREHRIEAVLCVPVAAWRVRGVLCVQRCGRPGAFSDRDRAQVELVQRELAVIADRLVRARTLREETRRLRDRLVAETLERTQWNITHTARALGVTRTFVYEVVRATGLKRP